MMVRCLLVLLFFPIFLFAQKTKLKEVYFYNSPQLSKAYSVLKKNKLIKHGAYKSYFENGKIKETGIYEFNLKVGEWIEFNNYGEPQKYKTYKKGKLEKQRKTGIWEKFYEGGKVIKRYDHDKEEQLETLFVLQIEFPRIARENNIQGVVEIGLVIDEDCEIKEINIVKSLETDCDEAALNAIRKLAELIQKYDKTKCTGIKQVIPVHFKIE